MGGFNFPSLETIQDQKNIMLVMRQLQLGQELATDLRIVISQAQLESGLTSFILDDIKHNLTYLEEGFIAHLRERLRELDGGIHVEGAWIPHLQRINDVSIMEKLLELNEVTKRELEHANQCRKYLRVITIAEIWLYDKYIEDGKSNFFIQDGIRYQPTHKSHPIEITQHGDRIQACNPYSIAIDQERKSRENGDEDEEETEEAGLQDLLSEEKLVACSDGSFDPIDCKAAFN
jgi:hypothetical protein